MIITPEGFNWNISLGVNVYKQCSKLYSSNPIPIICFQNDDSRRCINTIQPPDDEHIMLEIRRGL